MESESQMIKVEVAYALPDRQQIIVLDVEKGCSAFDAVKRSGIVEQFSEIELDSADMGVFSKRMDGKVLPAPKDYQLESMDRVEIYRPLLLDPKEARLLRAEREKAKKARAKALEEESKN